MAKQPEASRTKSGRHGFASHPATVAGFPAPLIRRAPDSQRGLLLTAGTVVDGTGSKPISSASVGIEGDRIIDVGQDGSVGLAQPHDRLSLEGLYILPGLIDAHVHLMGSAVGRDPYGRYLERYPDTRVLRAAATAQGFLARGVTTLRHLGHGDPRHVAEVKHAVSQALIPGPRLLTSGWAISQSGGHGGHAAWPQDLVDSLQPNAAFVDGEAALRQAVRDNVQAGADCIKVFATEGVISTVGSDSGMPNFTFGELEALVSEARDLGVKVAAHATGRTGAEHAVRAGVHSLEHGPDDFGPDLLDSVAASGTVIVPTLSVFRWVQEEGHVHGIPEPAVLNAASALRARAEFTRSAFAHGCELAIGSDSGTKPRLFGTAAEIAALGRTGLPAIDVIKAATLGGAKALGIEEEVGTITAGKRADLLVLDADPTQDPSVLGTAEHVKLIVQGGFIGAGSPGRGGQRDG